MLLVVVFSIYVRLDGKGGYGCRGPYRNSRKVRIDIIPTLLPVRVNPNFSPLQPSTSGRALFLSSAILTPHCLIFFLCSLDSSCRRVPDSTPTKSPLHSAACQFLSVRVHAFSAAVELAFFPFPFFFFFLLSLIAGFDTQHAQSFSFKESDKRQSAA